MPNVVYLVSSKSFDRHTFGPPHPCQSQTPKLAKYISVKSCTLPSSSAPYESLYSKGR